MADSSCQDTSSQAQLGAYVSIDKALTLLTAHDDTSKFVGLALLKSLLDNHEELRNDSNLISKCWAAVSAKFLDRLLRASQNPGNKSQAEARSMTDLAVAVIHSFTLLLSTAAPQNEKLVERTSGIVLALISSSEETTSQILQILVSISASAKGAQALLEMEDLSPLVEVAPSHHLALKVIQYALVNAIPISHMHSLLQAGIAKLMPRLVIGFKNNNSTTFLQFLAELLPKLPPSVFGPDDQWLNLLTNLLQNTILSSPTHETRRCTALICSTLLQAYPSTFPGLLFIPSSTPTSSEAKSFLYFFLNLTCIDLRASFPSLLELLASQDYPAISQRLAADFNILSAFIGFLAQTFEDEEKGAIGPSIPLAADELLKIRREFSETASLTIEFLRDRWDAAVSGTAGLHPSVRPTPGRPPSNSPLSLTWDNMDGGVAKDSLTLASIRYLGIWLRESDSDTLLKEAVGIIDVLLELYKADTELDETDDSEEMGYRYPILLALQIIITVDSSSDTFVQEGGWSTLSQDLKKIISEQAGKNEVADDSKVHRGIEITRVLFSLAENNSSGTSNEWISLVEVISSLPRLKEDVSSVALELRVSLYQLAAALLQGAPLRMRQRYESETAKIFNEARGVMQVLGEKEDACELREGVVEVVQWMQELGLSDTK